MARKIKLKSNKQKAPRTRSITEGHSGGIHVSSGHTGELSDSTNFEVIGKSLFGSDGRSAFYSVVEGDIGSSPEATIVPTIFSYRDLMKVYLASPILRECVDSYRTNIESYGFDYEYIGPTGQQESRAATNERTRIERLISSLTTDGRPLREHREDSRVDKEVLGSRAFEVIEDMAGRVVTFDHVPSITLRMTKQDKEYTDAVTYDIHGGAVKTQRRFRRFVQEQENGKRLFFKEYGDPRSISPETGKVDNSLPIEEQATAIYYEALYFPGNPCGVPRWAGVIPALLGGREAEMVNLEFFRDNAIPAMAVLVSGGALTEESFFKIEQYIDGVRGRTSMNRIVVLEATSEGADAAAIDGSLPAPKVDIKPMLSERQNEGLFKDYIQDGERKARQSFRLPPVYVGSASEYNRASAFASMLTADQQIFVPERFAWDQMFDRVVLSSHRFKFWRVRSAGPGITDPQEVARIVNSLGREGALTPNIAIKLANRYLDADIPAIAEDWGNVPYSSTLQLIKNDMVIKGINEFVDAVDSAVSPVDPNTDAQQTGQGLDNVQKVLRRLLEDVSDKLASDLDEAVQSIAAE